MAKLEMKRVRGVMCYWEYVAPKSNDDKTLTRLWHLRHAVPHDDDGYPIGPNLPKFITDCCDHRHVWTCWMQKYDPDEDGYDDNPEDIMGRAVTAWSIENGVTLLDLHPPEWVDWLAPGYIEEIRKHRNWSQIIEGGHNLYLGTARAVEKIIFKD